MDIPIARYGPMLLLRHLGSGGFGDVYEAGFTSDSIAEYVREQAGLSTPAGLEETIEYVSKRQDTEFSTNIPPEQLTAFQQQCMIDLVAKLQQVDLQRSIQEASAELRQAYGPLETARFALKQLTIDVDDTLLKRFEAEQREIQKVQDIEGVVHVYAVGALNKKPYIAMELLPGRVDHVKMRTEDAVSLVLTVSLTMAKVHQHHINHRDLKPDNILLDKHGNPKVTDFGIAKDENTLRSITESRVAMGTLWYMAPEQARDAKLVDHHADIYSLGATLYELVCGTRASYGGPMDEVLQEVQATAALGRVGDPAIELVRFPNEDLSANRALYEQGAQKIHDLKGMEWSLDRIIMEMLPDMRVPITRACYAFDENPFTPINPFLEAIILKAMAKDPSERYQHCMDFAMDLELWLRGGVNEEALSFARQRYARRNKSMSELVVAPQLAFVAKARDTVKTDWRKAMSMLEIVREDLPTIAANASMNPFVKELEANVETAIAEVENEAPKRILQELAQLDRTRPTYVQDATRLAQELEARLLPMHSERLDKLMPPGSFPGLVRDGHWTQANSNDATCGYLLWMMQRTAALSGKPEHLDATIRRTETLGEFPEQYAY